MRVSVCSTGQGTYGLRVRRNDVRRFFPPSRSTVDILLDHEFITAELPESFWSSSPVIRHPRIEAWLRERRLISWRKGAPPKLELKVDGPGIYRLEQPSREHRRQARPGRGSAVA